MHWGVCWRRGRKEAVVRAVLHRGIHGGAQRMAQLRAKERKGAQRRVGSQALPREPEGRAAAQSERSWKVGGLG